MIIFSSLPQYGAGSHTCCLTVPRGILNVNNLIFFLGITLRNIKQKINVPSHHLSFFLLPAQGFPCENWPGFGQLLLPDFSFLCALSHGKADIILSFLRHQWCWRFRKLMLVIWVPADFYEHLIQNTHKWKHYFCKTKVKSPKQKS